MGCLFRNFVHPVQCFPVEFDLPFANSWFDNVKMFLHCGEKMFWSFVFLVDFEVNPNDTHA